VSPRTAYWITDILSDPDARAYIFGRGTSLDLPFPVAVKTGTSQAYHDNWTIGYTRRVTVGVWVGNFNRRPLRNSSGVTGAAPIFQAVMLAAARRLGAVEETVARPDPSLAEADICSLSGERANSWCPVRRREWLPDERQPAPCSWHHASENGVVINWPAAYREWARKNGAAPDGASVRPPALALLTAGRPQAPRAPRRLELVNPPAGATYLIDPTLRREFQTLPLRVVVPAPTTIEWSVNDAVIGRVSSESVLEWPLRPGRHRVVARGTDGRTAESTISVR
jgi:penicillin-binding protein 1C